MKCRLSNVNIPDESQPTCLVLLWSDPAEVAVRTARESGFILDNCVVDNVLLLKKRKDCTALFA